MSSGSAHVTFAAMKRFIPSILANMPASWRGTTFNNSNLLGRAGFSSNLRRLIASHEHDEHAQLSTDELAALGESEDYLRVATNVSTTLEVALGLEKGFDVSQVFTFASRTMPIIAVALVTRAPVHVYVGSRPRPFTDDQLHVLSLLQCQLVLHSGGAPEARAGSAADVVLAYDDDRGAAAATVDGIIGDGVLYICNAAKISEAEILVRRKRMATPMTTPVAEARLRALAGLPSAAIAPPSADDVAALLGHLQVISGTAVHPATAPVCFTAGLPSMAALWLALIESGGVDVLMASTAYGGSSQITDLLSEASSGRLRKHTFDVQGTISVEQSISACLEGRAADAARLWPTTVLCLEMPTNPDMKIPELASVATALTNYTQRTGKRVLLLVDVTLAPNSRVIQKVHALAPSINTCVFVSMSKSVSRGMTTAGAFVFNGTDAAAALRQQVLAVAALLDTGATPDQMHTLVRNHEGVEERCHRAYKVAAAVGSALCAAVQRRTGHLMHLAFVSPEHAAQGFEASTFSFNLPAIAGAAPGVNEALAQRFVDLIAQHKTLFKPCVSFGQDNGLVYATVPATSTQGAIKAEDKAKQAQGGVQLVRLSFPPTGDADALAHVMDDALAALYER